MKVCFIVTSLKISGGVYVVLQHALHMSRGGANVTIAMNNTFDGVPGWHPGLTELRLCPLESVISERFDLAIATWWSTAYDLPRVNAAKYAYFVQLADYLVAPAHLRERAERTFTLGLDGITVSTKLSEELAEDYGMTADVALNGIDKEVFSTAGTVVSPRTDGRLRVLVEGPLGPNTKGVPYAIRLARKARPDEIWLLTTSKVGWYPGVDRVFCRLNAQGCASVYRSCDVLLKLSTVESCSLPILEMLHCGGAVVAYDIPGPDEYLAHECNALLLPVGDERNVVDALRSLKRNPALMVTLRAGAQATAERWPTWYQSSSTFHGLCLKLMTEPGPDREELRQITMAVDRVPQPTATVSASMISAAKSIVERSQKLNEIKTLARALLLEQRLAPRSVMQLKAEHRASRCAPFGVFTTSHGRS